MSRYKGHNKTGVPRVASNDEFMRLRSHEQQNYITAAWNQLIKATARYGPDSKRTTKARERWARGVAQSPAGEIVRSQDAPSEAEKG